MILLYCNGLGSGKEVKTEALPKGFIVGKSAAYDVLGDRLNDDALTDLGMFPVIEGESNSCLLANLDPMSAKNGELQATIRYIGHYYIILTAYPFFIYPW